MKTKIHETALIHQKAEIDSGVEIGPYSIIKKGVRIGRNTRLVSHVIVEGDTEIGENCTFHPFACIGLPPQDIKYRGEPTKLIIGSHNMIREYVTVHRASVGGDETTTLGNSNFLMAYVHVAHNCKIGSNIIMANAATLAGHVLIEDFAVIGGLVAIHQFTRIGQYAMVGGFSGIGQDIPPFMGLFFSFFRGCLFCCCFFGSATSFFTTRYTQSFQKDGTKRCSHPAAVPAQKPVILSVKRRKHFILSLNDDF